MREARAAFRLGRGIELVERRGKKGCFFRRQRAQQVLVKRRLDLRFGGFQALCLLRRIQQLAAPVVRCVPAYEIALCLQIPGPARNGSLVGVQKLGKCRLRAARVVAQGVNQIDFRRADVCFAQCAQDELFRLARNFGNFSLCNIHDSLRA